MLPKSVQAAFAHEARAILAMPVEARIHALGGYGPDGAVIYEGHPDGCPSVLVDTAGDAKATFVSNGSVAFDVTAQDGTTVQVLSGHFDTTEKRETGVPSNNLWLRLEGATPGARVAGLVNPAASGDLAPQTIRIVKLGAPRRALWFCASFAVRPGIAFRTAVRFRLVATGAGPALLRQAYVENCGHKPLAGTLWSFFNLHGTQRFSYNKEIWYDVGRPVAPGEIVAACSVPYVDAVQIKRVSSACGAGLRPGGATCDYTAFVGHSACSSLMPRAVREGRFGAGAGDRLNRFSIATVAAGRYLLALAPGASTCLLQSLLYVSEPARAAGFRRRSRCARAEYRHVARAFTAAAGALLRRTPGALAVAGADAGRAVAEPAFAVDLPRHRVLTEYARSLWTGVAELYENCRAHGAKMAQGIELGTRDRAQDMWPKMKEDPGRVRDDLVHAFGFMYDTVPPGAPWSAPLSRVEKLHGMYPRQYPSRWDNRATAVANDNRPYNDSAVWLVDSLNLYLRETGDRGILRERVPTTRLTRPEEPEKSGLTGHDRQHTVGSAVVEIFDAYARQVADSPYGLVQIMYGDWCDPVDMFGTSVVGDAATRGMGRGVQVRLSAHVFLALVETVDAFASPAVAATLEAHVVAALPRLQTLADTLRRNALRVAWEGGRHAGFVAAIHELRADGSRPDYTKGEKGYTLGSTSGSDFDGARRRDLTALAYGLRMLGVERDYLAPPDDAAGKIAAILATCDNLLYTPALGLRLLHPPIANNDAAIRLVGRMGIVPSGCAENGEYHHGQMMMHLFRLGIRGEADASWAQFEAIVSATRDTGLAGPFEMPATSYASDADDPHFGKGMYFGLSGSTDWIVEYLQQVAGVRLALHDPRGPALTVSPRLPRVLGGALTLRRTVHVAQAGGGYRRVPVTVRLLPVAALDAAGCRVRVNGRPAAAAALASFDGLSRVDVEIASAAPGV